jgi:glycosyltransferase involved in cell wall biosynthesis
VKSLRILFVGRTRYRIPLAETTRRKFEALERVAEVRVLASAADADPPDDETFHLVKPVRPRLLDGLAFHLSLPVRVARELRDFAPDAVLVTGAHDVPAVLLGRRIARSDARIVLDLHGDWRVSARLYGSRMRRIGAPIVDWLGNIGVRRADGVRTLSDFTTDLVREEGVEPVAEFPAFVDFGLYRERPRAPLPARAALLFVGVLEDYKGIDVLAEAWRQAAPRVPDAELRLVGRGPKLEVVEQLLVDLPRQTRWYPALDQAELVHELDRSTALVLPSRSEGLPRVVLEAFCRGRPVVGARAGGVVDLVRDGENGILVEVEDAEALADALVDVLLEPAWAGKLATGAARSASDWLATPAEFAERVRDLVASLD